MSKSKESPLEERFYQAWIEEFGNTLTPLRQYRFCETERYRLDFAWPDWKVGVELNGFGWGHTTVSAKKRDARKGRLLTLLGWKYLVYTSACVGSKASMHDALYEIIDLLQQQGQRGAQTSKDSDVSG